MELDNVIDIDVELEETPSIDINMKEAGPPGEKGEDGLSAYEVYQNAGGTLTEEEWLESLKGRDGYTPVKGTDYWTDEEQNEIKTVLENYIDNQLGVIENGSY